MKLRHSLFVLSFLAVPLLHCGDDDPPVQSHPGGDGGANGGDPAASEPDHALVPASKVDLLFVVDNSASMGDKQALLATSVSRILRRLVEPSADHKAVTDLHIGVISSSLGTLGGDVCDNADRPRQRDMAHLLNVGPDGKTVVAGAEQGFLSFAAGGDVAVLERAAKDIIVGVGQDGCGFEAQLESMYRFLSQPDPPAAYTVTNGVLTQGPVDDILLAQRKQFLRPDSAVAVVMLTDEDDSMVDPNGLKGQGWQFTNKVFPGSKVSRGGPQGATAPRGSSTCAGDPGSPKCVSCAACANDAICTEKNDANCTQSGDPTQHGPGYDGYYAPTDDDFNIRFYRMKQRFGVDPQYPIDRYVRGLTNFKVPNRDTEHDKETGAYVHAATCTNPLFAANLPATSQEEICNLAPGNRSRQLVVFQLIGGVPPGLAGTTPDWTAILGKDPQHYDYSGIDAHMIQSSTPRPALVGGGSATSNRGDNGTDPVNGREWDTQKKDLQYACTFQLPDPRSCTANESSCDCSDDPGNPGKPLANPPLCAGDGSATQTRGKAYPTLRELEVVKGLGDRGVVGSICTVDPTAGYGPLLETLATRLTPVLAK